MLERYTPAAAADADRFYTSEDATSIRKLLLTRRLTGAATTDRRWGRRCWPAA
jgi:hypothetical protein